MAVPRKKKRKKSENFWLQPGLYTNNKDHFNYTTNEEKKIDRPFNETQDLSLENE